MPEVTGRVEKMVDKQASNGGEYTAITLKGQKKGFLGAPVKSGMATISMKTMTRFVRNAVR